MTMSSLRSLRQRLNKSEHEYHSKGFKDVAKRDRSSVNSGHIFEKIEQAEGLKIGQIQMEDSHQNEEWQSSDERKVFEEQLDQLQEQLLIAMIENQNLKNELNASKNVTVLEETKVLLEYERRRNEILEKKCGQVSKKIHAHVTDRSKQAVLGTSRESSTSVTSGVIIDGDDSGEGSSLEKTTPRRCRFCHNLVEWLRNSVCTFLDDFTDEPMTNNNGDPDGDHLTVKTLKENIKRFGSGAKPSVNTIKGIYNLLAWKSPPYTLIVFVVYMYSVWQGWFFPVLLFCFSFRLFINFLRHRGWNISFNFFETQEEPKDEEEKELGVTDKFNLVMHVARKVQNFLGEVTDHLEKIKSLLTWRHPEASQYLFLVISTAFLISCFMSTTFLFFYAGLGLGIKLFIVDYIYNRFPRVRRKYDSTWRLWNELPTDIEFEKRNIRSEIDKGILHQSYEKGDFSAETKSGHMSMDARTFCDIFSLPESEFPLPGWHGGRRCTLIRKDKSFTAAFKHGRLFLTHSFLCFERTKIPSPKNIVIPLEDIVRLEKVKPFGWMPGELAIEISIVGNEKPYIFGAIINRDEIFEGILKAGHKAGLSWSTASSLID